MFMTSSYKNNRVKEFLDYRQRKVRVFKNQKLKLMNGSLYYSASSGRGTGVKPGINTITGIPKILLN